MVRSPYHYATAMVAAPSCKGCRIKIAFIEGREDDSTGLGRRGFNREEATRMIHDREIDLNGTISQHPTK